MANLTIPEKYRQGIAVLLRLPDRSVQEIAAKLKSPPPMVTTASVAPEFAKVAGISADDANELVEALLSLYLLRADLDISVPELVGGIAQAIKESNSPDLQVPAADEDRLVRNLAMLLGVESFQAKFKETELSLEHEHVFCAARILTDIRPVFGQDPSAPPIGAFLIHNLKISYHESTGELHHMFIAMDSDELAVLKGVIDRAELKVQGLQALLGAARLPQREEE